MITTLSFGLEPRSVGTDGTYDQLADSLLQHGVLEAVPGPKDLRCYGEQVRSVLDGERVVGGGERVVGGAEDEHPAVEYYQWEHCFGCSPRERETFRRRAD